MPVFLFVFEEEIERTHLLTARFREIGLEPMLNHAIKGSDLSSAERKKFQGMSWQNWTKEAFHINVICSALNH